MKKPQNHPGANALAAALFMSAVGVAPVAPAAPNPPPAPAIDRTNTPGDEARRTAWQERRDGNAEGVLQRETQMTRLLGRPEVVKELNLSDDQLQVLKTARENVTRRCVETIRQLETSLARQVELLKQDHPDAAALDEAVETSGRLRTELAKLRMQHLVLVLQTINSDQRRKLNALLRDAGGKDQKLAPVNGRRERVKQILSDRKGVDAGTNAPAKQP